MGYTKTIITFMAGAAVGAIAGILLAPDKGSDTRQKLVSKKNDLVDAMKTKFARQANDINETGISESGNTTNDGERERTFDTGARSTG